MKKTCTRFPVALGALVLANSAMCYEPAVDDPAWWTDSLTSIYTNDTPPVGYFSHSAPINVGQLKYVSAQAKNVLDQELGSIGAGPYIDVLVSSFTTSDPGNFAPANIGQLKNTTSAFYERFAAIGFGPGDAGWPASLTLTEGNPNLNDGVPIYPWTANQTSENTAPANIGQLKHLFSWDIAEYVVVDSEPDFLPDYWEYFYFNDLDEVADGDPDLDGRTNLQEYEAGTDPTVAPALLINEPFAYSTGDIDGLAVGLGTGLLGTWSGTLTTVDDGTSIVASSSALAYGPLARDGGELKLLDRANMYASVDSTMLNDAGVLDDGSTLWISFIVRTDDATGTNNKQSFAFGTDQILAHQFEMKMDNSGSGVGISLDRGSRLNAAYWDGGIRTYSDTITTSPGTTNLVVLSITWGASGEIIRLYLPGTDLSLPEVVETIITPGNLDQSSFDTITYSHRGTNDVSDQIDEIRFATTYQGLFGAGGIDTTAPTITALSPADDATGVEVNSNLVATFDEDVTRGTGQIVIKNLTDTTQSTIDITDETQVSISANTLTVDPSFNLDAGKDYAIRIDSTAIIDLAGNSFAGINDDATWNFTNTAPLGGQLFSEDFETPSSPTAYSEGVTPAGWVRADQGYGSNRHGIIDQAGGDFTASDPGEQAYAFRYTNSGITTGEGVVGTLNLNTTYTLYVDVVRDDGGNAGTPYEVELVAFDPGADRSECRSIRPGTVLASSIGDAPSDGTWDTVSVQFDAGSSHPHQGKDIAVRLIGGSTSAIIDNVFVTATSAGDNGGGEGNSDDSDGDGLTYDEEIALGTSPSKSDTDGDGISDGEEVNTYGTSPVSKDTDKDGLEDHYEIFSLMTDPLSADTDGDNLSDYEELHYTGTSRTEVDTDFDQINDDDELRFSITGFEEEGGNVVPDYFSAVGHDSSNLAAILSNRFTYSKLAGQAAPVGALRTSYALEDVGGSSRVLVTFDVTGLLSNADEDGLRVWLSDDYLTTQGLPELKEVVTPKGLINHSENFTHAHDEGRYSLWFEMRDEYPNQDIKLFFEPNTSNDFSIRIENVNLYVLTDEDSDQLPDSWEIDHFGNLDASTMDDPDSDGVPNYFEFYHRTDPTDASEGLTFENQNQSPHNYYIVDSTIGVESDYTRKSLNFILYDIEDYDMVQLKPVKYRGITAIKKIAIFSNEPLGDVVVNHTETWSDGLAPYSDALYPWPRSVFRSDCYLKNLVFGSDYPGHIIRSTLTTFYGEAYIFNCKFSGHTNVGAISIAEGNATLVNCLIAGNEGGSSHSGSGSAVSVGPEAGAILFRSCTIVDNIDREPNDDYDVKTGQTFSFHEEYEGVTTLTDCIVWNEAMLYEFFNEDAVLVMSNTIFRDESTGKATLNGIDLDISDFGFNYTLTEDSLLRDTRAVTSNEISDHHSELCADGYRDIGWDEFVDSDGDGLPDWLESQGVEDANGDFDGDTLSNLYEFATSRTDPRSKDTDNDGLSDAYEINILGTNPLDPDTDNDNRPDFVEDRFGLEPTIQDVWHGDDADRDGLADDIEITFFPEAAGFPVAPGSEYSGFGYSVVSGREDSDNDGAPNFVEIAYGLDPLNFDSDGDLLIDGVELLSSQLDPFTPNLAEDGSAFGNHDFDGDGLSDLFEVSFGTDPLDADTNNNGVNDGEELDNGGDPINPGPPPDPINPGDPPGPDSPPPPPSPILTGNYDILVEHKEISFPKHGHSTFESIDPAKRFLLKTAIQTYGGSDGEVESGPFGISGTGTCSIDPITGEQTRDGDKYEEEFYVISFGDAVSPFRLSGTRFQSGYSDPPDDEPDGTATIHGVTLLSEENTTAMMVTNGENELEDYEGDFSTLSEAPHAYRNVHENELHFDYRKTQFKFKWQSGVDPEAKLPIRYFVLFIPEDDPDTEENEEETGLEIVDTIEWDGVNEDEIFEIDPVKLKPGEDGRYELLKVDLEASEYAEQSPFIGASRSDSLALPFQLDQSEEESEGITLGVNNDDDDLSGIADMTQIAGDTNVSGENDSAAVRIRFSAIDSINNGTVSIELKKTSGEFGTRLWKDRFDKSHTMLVAAATTGIELTPADSNADIGINGSANGATTKSWDLSDSTEKADLLDIINNRKVLWLEGLSTGEGEIALKLEIGGAEVFEDKIKVTVVESKTVKNQTVAYADAVKNTHFGAVSNSDSVRNYHGGDDVIIPIAFYPGAESRSEPTTYDVVAPSERNSLKAIMDSRGLRAYVVSSIVDQAGQPSAGGFAYADIGALVIIADAGDVEYVHEYTHLRGQIEHTCVTDNYMWGDGCEHVPSGIFTDATQSQHDLVF